jgi:hypothetical protein
MQDPCQLRRESIVWKLVPIWRPRTVRSLGRHSGCQVRQPTNRHAASSTVEPDCATPELRHRSVFITRLAVSAQELSIKTDMAKAESIENGNAATSRAAEDCVDARIKDGWRRST